MTQDYCLLLLLTDTIVVLCYMPASVATFCLGLYFIFSACIIVTEKCCWLLLCLLLQDAKELYVAILIFV